MDEVEIARVASPRRAIPGEDPGVARLSAITTALLSELVIQRERIDTLERILEQQGILASGAIDAFEPDAIAEGERRALRRRQIDKVLRQLKIDAALAADAAATARSIANADQVLEQELQA